MIPEPTHILLIEDNPGDARLIEYMLQETDQPGFVFHWVNRLSAGLEQLAVGQFAVVLLDLTLPDSQGSDTFTRLHAQAPDLPVIILTGLGDLALATTLMRDGAEDYLVKGQVDGALLVRSIRYAIERKRLGEELAKKVEELHRTNAQLQAIFQAIPDLFFILADDGTVTDWKGGKANLFLPPESFLGRKLHEVLPAGVGERAKKALEKVVAQQETHMAEFSVPVAGGELSFETWLCPLEAGSVLAIVRNVTERKQLNQTIQKARSDLLFSISHEMKTPLMNITAAREMLATLPETDRQNRQLEYEETWERNLRRLRRLIDNLVDSQRVQTTGLKLLRAPCDLPAVIHRVFTEEATYAATRKVRLIERMDAIPLMDLDEETIERLIENLVTNAIKYSLPDGRAEIVLEQRTGEVVLSMADHGCGIPADEQAALFQPFQRSSEAVRKGTPGTGLGLYVAKIIAEAHGGSIELRSVTGEGTVVTVRFPLPEQAA